ncbi:MAG: hypothetical protein HC852_01830 [Acaryochloridaceae cyanobacterium RU_4_10]|nr:hypothetical protein [Acaryochloridaceae cyanobacterium RU_4_10]
MISLNKSNSYSKPIESIDQLRELPGVRFAGKTIRLSETTGELESVITAYSDIEYKNLPTQIEGLPITFILEKETNAEVSGNNHRYDTIQGGIQIGPVSWTNGTLGLVVKAAYGRLTFPCILTATHVMKLDTGLFSQYCYQPASDKTGDQVGIYFRDGGVDNDCCLYKVEEEYRLYSSGILGICSTLKSPVTPKIGMKVQKMGQVTERTCGVITRIGNNQIIIEPDQDYYHPPYPPICKNGDSGALWVTNMGIGEFSPVALLLRYNAEKNYSVGLSAEYIQTLLDIRQW